MTDRGGLTIDAARTAVSYEAQLWTAPKLLYRLGAGQDPLPYGEPNTQALSIARHLLDALWVEGLLVRKPTSFGEAVFYHRDVCPQIYWVACQRCAQPVIGHGLEPIVCNDCNA